MRNRTVRLGRAIIHQPIPVTTIEPSPAWTERAGRTLYMLLSRGSGARGVLWERLNERQHQYWREIAAAVLAAGT